MIDSQDTGPETYNVVVRGRPFLLHRFQIERDSPNFFTSYFLNSASERTNKNTRLDISRDPDVFELVLRYLNGYQVMPIQDRFVPSGSTLEMTLADLRVDAEFYQLRGLIDLCKAPKKDQVVELVASYAVVTGHLGVSKDGMSPTEDLATVVPRFSVSPLSEATYDDKAKHMLAVTNETINMASFLLVSAWSDHIVRAVMSKQPSVRLWQIMGWERKLDGGTRHATIFVKLHSPPGIPLK
ncbi:hypothetical protein BDV93DRAFT_482222 [Ceratobasidium sp. AG-I]|nr:hypothetical protein BDV93DRAFT_482222 [Ceratobasidium sp. AG-I]